MVLNPKDGTSFFSESYLAAAVHYNMKKIRTAFEKNSN